MNNLVGSILKSLRIQDVQFSVKDTVLTNNNEKGKVSSLEKRLFITMFTGSCLLLCLLGHVYCRLCCVLNFKPTSRCNIDQKQIRHDRLYKDCSWT